MATKSSSASVKPVFAQTAAQRQIIRQILAVAAMRRTLATILYPSSEDARIYRLRTVAPLMLSGDDERESCLVWQVLPAPGWRRLLLRLAVAATATDEPFDAAAWDAALKIRPATGPGQAKQEGGTA